MTSGLADSHTSDISDTARSADPAEPTATDAEPTDLATADGSPAGPARPALPRRLLSWARRPSSRLPLITFAVTQVIGLIWWIGFYPGVVTPDTVTYVWQVSTGNWMNDHSVAYDVLVWLSLKLSARLSLLTLVQTTVTAISLAYAVTGLRRLRIPGWWLTLAASLMLVLPAVGMQVVYVSKDTGFVLAQVFLLGTLARIVALRTVESPRGGPKLPVPRYLIVLVFVELLLTGLFRNNGFMVIAIGTVVTVLVLAGLRWRMLIAGAAAFVGVFVFNLAIYPALGVESARAELLMGPVWADIAVAYADRPETFTTADTDLMRQVAPLEFWRDTANCYSSDTTVAYALTTFSIPAARERSGELLSLWLDILERTPGQLIGTRMCRGTIAWSPWPAPADKGHTIKLSTSMTRAYLDRVDERLGPMGLTYTVKSHPISKDVRRVLLADKRFFDNRNLEFFSWRGVTWAYVAYLAVGLWAWRRRQIAVVALAAVIVGNQLTVLVNNPNQLVRYMAAPMFLGILLVPMIFTGRRRLNAGDEPAPGPDAGGTPTVSTS